MGGGWLPEEKLSELTLFPKDKKVPGALTRPGKQVPQAPLGAQVYVGCLSLAGEAWNVKRGTEGAFMSPRPWPGLRVPACSAFCTKRNPNLPKILRGEFLKNTQKTSPLQPSLSPLTNQLLREDLNKNEMSDSEGRYLSKL